MEGRRDKEYSHTGGNELKLTVLVDNNTYIDQYHLGEPALSYYIEDEDTKLLLDVGYSDVFLRNAATLGIDLDAVTTIAISHGHDDHTGGLKPFFNKAHDGLTIVAHPEAFKAKFSETLDLGSPLLEDDLKERCHLVLSREPVQLSPNITFLGEIPQMNSFEKRKPFGMRNVDGIPVSDDVPDDTALVYKSEDGLRIITGCSHSGICNIIEYAKKVCRDDRVIGIIGGLHLVEMSEQVENTIAYFEENHIRDLYACHCTSFAVKAEIHKVLPIIEVGVGLELHW
jgi:7,8-dihydropterin-6-yl-methyl-4-(beta-D-ribofuranosyl)aminobenzene 5'-phosphate synthase